MTSLTSTSEPIARRYPRVSAIRCRSATFCPAESKCINQNVKWTPIQVEQVFRASIPCRANGDTDQRGASRHGAHAEKGVDSYLALWPNNNVDDGMEVFLWKLQLV